MNLSQRLLFAVIYLIVDFIYVVMSRNYYSGIVRGIQGSIMKSKPFAWQIATLTYAIMAIGWFIIVGPVAESSSALNTLAHALLVALLMYGVFNGIMYIMFDAWSAMVAFRDLAWGLSWMSILSILYWFYLRSRFHERKSSMS